MQGKTVLFVALFAWAVTAPAVSTGELTVRIVNRTAKAPPLPELTVLLHTYMNGQEVGEQEAQTDSRHRAVFRGLPVGEGSSYAVQVSYHGVKYESEPIQLTDASGNAPVELPIYETTPSSDAVQVQIQHTVMRPLRDALEVQEMYLLQNRTDRTYVGNGEVKPGLRRVLEFVLPVGFTNVQVGEGLMLCCIVTQENGFVETMEIKPGERVVQFSYSLPYIRSRLTFRPSFLAFTRQYNLLVSPDLRVANVSGLEPMGQFNASRAPYLRYAARDLAPGKHVSIEFSGLPVDRIPLLRWLTLAVAGSLVLVLVWWILHSRGLSRAQVSRSPLDNQRSRILEEIVRLDEAFEAGKLSRADYQFRRNSKKAELANLGAHPHRPS